jgi:hypothetical protein
MGDRLDVFPERFKIKLMGYDGGKLATGNVHSVLENVLKNPRSADLELVDERFEVSNIDLIVLAGENFFLTVLTSEQDILDKTKCLLETVANLRGNAHSAVDVFELSGIKLVGVAGEELIVVTGEQGSFSLREVTAKELIVGEFAAGIYQKPP